MGGAASAPRDLRGWQGRRIKGEGVNDITINNGLVDIRHACFSLQSVTGSCNSQLKQNKEAPVFLF
jgi:hypothetical protein